MMFWCGLGLGLAIGMGAVAFYASLVMSKRAAEVDPLEDEADCVREGNPRTPPPAG